ncbi:methyltransferase domain-containing protein [Corynebacterium choanae]|uniref:23S rRNA (Guanine(748)-N(1))-methyltransferase n=1 Tax=Corynebacterium choanae TaxID=1862358 RepID=A0A3G6J5N9_9CORY|nr:methyltransferase domain-containing protein [Corynebacterium choanae]AZA13256.1 23S rRNA (guanine(748)-N(1))-methyltransferase [Corynebacterium choanae]
MLDHVLTTIINPATGARIIGRTVSGDLADQAGGTLPVTDAGFVDARAADAPVGDDAAMVAARETFLSTGQFAPFVEAVTEEVLAGITAMPIADTATAVIADLGAGTGYYLAHTLDAGNNLVGIGIDVAEPAAEKLVHAHRGITSVCADATTNLPLADDSVEIVTAIFAPCNPQEVARVLHPYGQLIVVVALPGHLDELRQPLGTAAVTHDEVAEILEEFSTHFVPAAAPTIVEFPMDLDATAIATQIAMSPAARHIDPEVLADRAAQLPAKMTVHARAGVYRFGRRPQQDG